MSEIQAFAKEIVENVTGSDIQAAPVVTNPLGNCPLCNALVSETKMAYSCSNWRATNCSFKIWKTIANKDISESTAKELLKNKKTKVLKGFKSKAGASFDAMLTLVEDGSVKFEFDNSANKVGKCPQCGGDVVERKSAFGCDNWKSQGCSFVIWKEQSGKTVTREEAIEKLKGN